MKKFPAKLALEGDVESVKNEEPQKDKATSESFSEEMFDIKNKAVDIDETINSMNMRIQEYLKKAEKIKL